MTKKITKKPVKKAKTVTAKKAKTTAVPKESKEIIHPITKERLWSVSELAKLYKKDNSHIASLIRDLKLAAHKIVHNDHVITAISTKDKERLEKQCPQFKSRNMSEGEVTLNDLAKERQTDTSSLLKFLKKHKYKIQKRRNPEKGRDVNVISATERQRLNKEHPKILRALNTNAQ